MINQSPTIQNIIQNNPYFKRKQAYFKGNPEAIIESAKAIADFPKFLRKPIGNLLGVSPMPVSKFVLSASFGEGVTQSIQEINTMLAPKFFIPLFLKGSLMGGWHEALVEPLEWYALYFFSTKGAIGLSSPLASILKLPHNELLGKRIFDLKKDYLNKHASIGTVNPKEVFLNNDLYKRVCLGKSMNFLGVASLVILAEIMAPAIRVLLTNKFLKTTNFYKISGLKTNDNQDQDGQGAIIQAKKNIKNALKLILLTVPTILALTYLLFRSGLYKFAFFEKFSKIFDLGNKFSLSRSLLISTIIPAAAYGYNTTALNLAEAKENVGRMLLSSWPLILFFKQIAGTIFGGLTAALFGVGNIISNPFKTWKAEVKTGERDPFDHGYIPLKKDIDGIYKGKVLELNKVKKLAIENPIKYNKMLKWTYFMKQHAPIYVFALPLGILIAWYNYKRTVKIHEDSTNNKENKDLSLLERFIDRIARFFYSIQEKTMKDSLIKK